jgi:hypothetical protein
METALLITSCKCGNCITIEQIWMPGGVNDSGGFVVKCSECGVANGVHIGCDVRMSRVSTGATLLARYDDDRGDREATVARYGLK